MADLNDLQSAQSVKLVGADSAGAENTPVDATSAGALHTNLRDSSGNELQSFDLNNTGGVAKVLGVSIRGLANGSPVELGNTANPFRIDPVGTTPQPVSQNGIWTVQPGNTANTTPWRNTISWGGADAVVTAQNASPLSAGLITRPVPYEPATFTATVEAVVLGNNKSLLAIQNTGSSVVKIREIWLINDRTAALTGVPVNFKLVRITSFTGGTVVTSGTHDTNDTLPAGISLATGATVSGASTVYRTHDWSSDEWSTGTLDQEGLDHAIQYNSPFWTSPSNTTPITLRQNQGLHVICATNTTNGQFNLRIVFTVE